MSKRTITDKPIRGGFHKHSQNRRRDVALEITNISGCWRKYCEAILDNINTPVFLKNYDLDYVYVNHYFEQIGNVTFEQIEGKNDYEIFPKSIADVFREQDEEVLRRKESIEFEETIVLPDGPHTFITSKFLLVTSEGKIDAVGGVCTDITARKQAEDIVKLSRESLERRVKKHTVQLEAKTKKLMEANNALNILLEKREEDRRNFEENVMNNIEKLVYPYLEKIKINQNDSTLESIVNILRSNLEEITSNFVYNQRNFLTQLTPAQIEVANLIKLGYTTKEIASLLCLSPSTIACHRQEIRKRLSITHQKVNLQSILRADPDNYKA